MNQPTSDQIFLAVEKLLRSSGHCGQLVSVVSEASKYCYKTVDGKIGVVDQHFIHELIWKENNYYFLRNRD